MTGLLLTLAATFFSEAQESIGKNAVLQRQQSIYTMGFLSMFWGMLFFLCIIFFVKKEFLFSLASLPTFLTRAVLELILAHVSILAITRADRSTYSLIRTGTIPLLLVADIALGYSLSISAVVGIGIIAAVLISLFYGTTIRTAGAGLAGATMVLAAATISLYKYDITHFNSVEAEQSIIIAILLGYFFLMARYKAGENPLAFLRQPLFLFQSLSAGLADVLMSFAYLFGAASIITTAKRALSVLWAILAGHRYFKETRLLLKLLAFAVIAAGLVLISL